MPHGNRHAPRAGQDAVRSRAGSAGRTGSSRDGGSGGAHGLPAQCGATVKFGRASDSGTTQLQVAWVTFGPPVLSDGEGSAEIIRDRAGWRVECAGGRTGGTELTRREGNVPDGSQSLTETLLHNDCQRRRQGERRRGWLGDEPRDEQSRLTFQERSAQRRHVVKHTGESMRSQPVFFASSQPSIRLSRH